MYFELEIATFLIWCFIQLARINCDLDVIYGSNEYVKCPREMPELLVPKTAGGNGFKIKIIGKPEKFKPGGLYTGWYLKLVSLLSPNPLHPHLVSLTGDKSSQQGQQFIGFMLVVEPKDSPEPSSSLPGSPQPIPQVGSFQVKSLSTHLRLPFILIILMSHYCSVRSKTNDHPNFSISIYDASFLFLFTQRMNNFHEFPSMSFVYYFHAKNILLIGRCNTHYK